ncbi:hypothetical protein R6Q59_004265 [Mikania micrantha]
MGFNFSRAVDGGRGKASSITKDKDIQPQAIETNNRFAALEDPMGVDDSGGEKEAGSCSLNKEAVLDVGRILPRSITNPRVHTTRPPDGVVSAQQKNRILEYINIT